MKCVRVAMPCGIARVSACALAVGLVLSAGQVQAETNWGEEYAKKAKSAQEVSPLGDDAFGDRISLFNGAVTFNATDVSIPGNNALPVALKRVYVPSEFHNPGVMETYAHGYWSLDFPNMMEDWQVDVPYISAVYPNDWTGGWNGVPPEKAYNVAGLEWLRKDYWHGINFNQDGGGQLLLGLTSDPKRVRPGGTVNLGTVAQPQVVPFNPTLGTKEGWVFHNGARMLGPTDANGNVPSGFGIVARDPQGNTYYLNWLVKRDHVSVPHPIRVGYIGGVDVVLRRKELRLYVTRVEDRFGNWVNYTWNNAKPHLLDRIESSDQRVITISYKPVGLYSTYIDKVTANGRQWTYNYGENGHDGLSSVIQPDGSAWRFAQTGHRLDMIEYVETRDVDGNVVKPIAEEAPCSGSSVFVGNPSTYSITHPGGATAKFTFKATRHGRTNVAWACLAGDQGQPRTLYPLFQDVMSVQSKVITGAGLPAGGLAYNYTYANLAQGYQPQDESVFPFNSPPPGSPGWNASFAPPVPNYKTVTVIEPDGTQQIHTFGKDWEINEGQLLQTETRKGGVSLKTVRNSYITDAEAATLPFPSAFGSSLTAFADKMPSYLRPLKSTVITQDGASFESRVAQQAGCGSSYCFDALARPTATFKSSSLGFAKLDTVEFHDNTSKWLLGQTARTTTDGVEVSRTEFDAVTALPIETYKFGDLQETYTYNTDGTLQSVSDASGNVTTLSSWKRGIPQYIQHPSAAGAPAENEQASVSDDGVILWADDENDARTCYTYDSMLRIKEIAHSSETQANVCNLAWNKTTVAFDWVTAPEYGIAANHWRQTTRTGAAKKTAYFDSLLRPLVTVEEDTTDAATVRVSARKYDTRGRVASDYYPKAGGTGADDLADFTLGTHTVYDGLGRVTSVKQDSELGTQLTTSTTYGSPAAPFTRMVTDPKGNVIRQTFQAFDVPTFDTPVRIDAPENTSTTIVRDVFGKPLELNRGTTN